MSQMPVGRICEFLRRFPSNEGFIIAAATDLALRFAALCSKHALLVPAGPDLLPHSMRTAEAYDYGERVLEGVNCSATPGDTQLALPLLVSALRTHVASPTACFCIAHALTQGLMVCMDSSCGLPQSTGKCTATVTVEASMLIAVASAMKVHKADERIFTSLCSVLGTLTMKLDVAQVASMFREGTMSLLVESLRLHAASASLCNSVGFALRFIASCDAGRGAVIGAGAVPLLAAAVTRHGRGEATFVTDTLRCLGFSEKGVALKTSA